MKQKKEEHLSPFFYDCCRLIAWLFFKVFCRVHLIILEQPASQGRFILASNHISHFEPALLSSFFPRSIDWVAMEELFAHRWSARFFSWLNAIPVNRFGKNPQLNQRALIKIKKRLAQKRVLGLFPEGGIRTEAASILNGAPIKSGLAILSILTQTPIIPCVVLGTDRLYDKALWLRRPSLWIIIGEKIVPPSKKTITDKEALFDFQKRVSSIFSTLQQELCKRFQLTSEDLPRSPKSKTRSLSKLDSRQK